MIKTRYVAMDLETVDKILKTPELAKRYSP